MVGVVICIALESAFAVVNKMEGFVAKLTALGGGSGDSREIYEHWAPTYERNLQQDYGYIAPQIAADTFAKYCTDRNAQILDLGCGTGLVGKELFERGFSKLDGLDISTNMLDVARRKGGYKNLLIGDMTQTLDLGGKIYDAAIGVGCFGGGHIGTEHILGIIGSVRSEGLLIFYINGIPYEQDDYQSHFRSLEATGEWNLLLLEKSNYMQKINRPGWVAVGRKA